MDFAALLLLCSIPQMDGTAKVVADSSPTSGQSNSRAYGSDSGMNATTIAMVLPSAPIPKVKTDLEPIVPNPGAQPFQPVKPIITRQQETTRQRRIWYGLLLAGHSGAAFDAWSTKRAVSGGYGKEANPLLRPFAGSNRIYAATQVSPAFMDFLGRRMMVSQHVWVRKVWWLPQAAGASFSFAAGAHNVGVVH
jgi:hypothetical protein